MEANQINEAPATVSETATGKSKMSKGQMIGMVVLTIAALAGVAFGVFGMVEKDKAEKNLAIKITDTAGKVTDIITDKITSVDENGTVTEITDTNVTTEAVNPEDYIYIGEWGLKIRIPNELAHVTYTYNYDGAAWGLQVSGAKVGGHDLPEFAQVDECQLGMVVRYSKQQVEAGMAPEMIGDNWLMIKDDFYYHYIHPHALCMDYNDNAFEQWEIDTTKLIQDMLSNKDNYSKI